MTLGTIFDISGSALTAETARMATSSSNITNANIEAGSSDQVYKLRYPIFKSVQEDANQWIGNQIKAGVQLKGTFVSTADPIKHHQPDNPIADKDGYVYTPNVNTSAEMANVISAARSYQMNLELVSTAKQLMQRTLQLGE